MAHMARCIRDSADNTQLSRFLAEAPWREDAIDRRRIRCLLQQTKPHRRRRRESLLALDDTLGEHGGSRFAHVDRHYTHSDGTDPLAPTPVTRCAVRGPVCFPLDLRLYRRYEALTPWEAAVAQHCPDLQLPTAKKARKRLHQQVAPVLLQDPEFRARPAQFRTTIALALALVEAALQHKGPLGVVVCDAWYLAAELIQVWARRRKAWISLLNTHRLLETASVPLRDAHGWTLKRPGPHIAVADLVPLIPANADRPVTVGAHTYWCFTVGVRLPTLGKVRLVVSFERESLPGRHGVRVTTRLDGNAAKIIGLSLQRWPTATVAQDGKGHLGFTAYRLRSAEAMGNHGWLVFVASSRWPLTWLPAGPDRTQGLMHPMGDACRHQGRAWLQKLLLFVHEPWSGGAAADHVVAQVFAKQRGMVLG